MACDNACKLKIILCGGGVIAPLQTMVALAPMAGKLSDAEAAELIAEMEEMEERAQAMCRKVERAVK